MVAFKIAIIAVFYFFLEVVDGQEYARHTCAVSCSDNVVCWGDNSYGQLGSDNNMTTMNYVNINNVIQISVGGYHTCALKNDGTVACWGLNIFGQLGNSQNSGTENLNFTPLIVNIMDVKQIATGLYHTCALKNDSTVACWGNNYFGQLGNSHNSVTDKPNFTPLIVNITDVKQISSGIYHTCALKNDSTVACWGRNKYGQLGNSQNSGTTNPNFTPLDVNITNVKQISAGQAHTCALKNAGTVACWGYNRYSQLGNPINNGTDFPNFTPVDVNITNVKQISAGAFHTCALKTDNTVACCGIKTSFGNVLDLNFSSYTDEPEKMAITQEGNIVQVTAGFVSTCILYDTREIYCTGSYEIGNPNRTFSFQKDKSILYYKTVTNAAFLEEKNDENICLNTKDDDFKLSILAIIWIAFGSVLLLSGIIYFILKRKGLIGVKNL